jgi:hypothetical protein
MLLSSIWKNIVENGYRNQKKDENGNKNNDPSINPQLFSQRPNQL